MKIFLTLLSIFTFTLFLFITSCGGDGPTDEMIEAEEFVDDVNAEETAADTSATGVYQEEVDENEETSLQNALAGEKEPVVEEGGMSFCDCVKKNKELSDLMLETEDDAVFDKAMADLEAMKTDECKILFAGKQNTIDEKKAHERKVKRCLSN